MENLELQSNLSIPFPWRQDYKIRQVCPEYVIPCSYVWHTGNNKSVRVKYIRVQTQLRHLLAVWFGPYIDHFWACISSFVEWENSCSLFFYYCGDSMRSIYKVPSIISIMVVFQTMEAFIMEKKALILKQDVSTHWFFCMHFFHFKTWN